MTQHWPENESDYKNYKKNYLFGSEKNISILYCYKITFLFIIFSLRFYQKRSKISFKRMLCWLIMWLEWWLGGKRGFLLQPSGSICRQQPKFRGPTTLSTCLAMKIGSVSKFKIFHSYNVTVLPKDIREIGIDHSNQSKAIWRLQSQWVAIRNLSLLL